MPNHDRCPGCNKVVYPPLGHKWSEHGPYCYTCLAARLSNAEAERDEARRDIEAWLRRHLDTNIKPRGYADPSGHPHGWSVVEIPDWEVRRKLDNLAEPPRPSITEPADRVASVIREQSTSRPLRDIIAEKIQP